MPELPRQSTVTPGEIAAALQDAGHRFAADFGIVGVRPWGELVERERALVLAAVRNVLIEQGLRVR